MDANGLLPVGPPAGWPRLPSRGWGDLQIRSDQARPGPAAIDDPWQALVTFIERNATRQARDRGLYEALTGLGDDERQARIWPEIITAVTELVDRAHHAGAVRAGVAPQDIALIFALLGPTFDMSRSTSPGLWQRYLALILDGLRATDRPDLPAPAPPIDALPAILKLGKRR